MNDLSGVLDALGKVEQQYTGCYAGVAISMPGRIDTKKGLAYTGGSFEFIKDAPFTALVEQRFGVPVIMANDGKCAANAEVFNGALSDVENGAVLVLGTATGGGIVLNGKVWMGSTFAAGEFSFIPMDFKKMAGAADNFADASDDFLWSKAMSATGLLWRYAVRKGLPAESHGIDGIAFFKAYDAGEPEAQQALADFGRYAAAGIYAIQSVLDLQRYAIGGGIGARPEVTRTIQSALDDLYSVYPKTPFCKPEIVRCYHGSNANLLGALRFFLANAQH